MTLVAIRLFIFTFLPLVFAALVILFDKRTNKRYRRIEVFLIALFGLGLAGSGISGFFGHLFLADIVAQSIAWPSGNPFQQEVGFANLAIGMLGLFAAGRRDGFREAAVLAATIFGFGATVVHLVDIGQTGNLAPGNTLQNVSNLLRPALLIGFLIALRREEPEKKTEQEASSFEQWRMPIVQATGLLTAIVATGFGVGFAFDKPVIGAVLSTLLGLLVSINLILRARATNS